MSPPDEDLKDRQPVWDALQFVWMDTDTEVEFPRIVEVCAQSKYSIAELEQIFWNEVEPAVGFNMWSVAGEWAGFEIDGLSARILEKSRFGRRLPIRIFRKNARDWWRRLEGALAERRGQSNL